MASTTTSSSAVPSPTLVAAPGSVPSLEDLYLMTSEPDARVVIRGVDWAFYERLVDSIPEGANIHVDYDGRERRDHVPQPDPRWRQEARLGQLVEAIAQELEIPYKRRGADGMETA